MIFDKLSRKDLYLGLGEGFATGLEYLAETDLAGLDLGRHEIQGDEIFVLVMEYETKPVEEAKWESHRKYHDIQYIISGNEYIAVNDLDLMDLGEYDPDKDFQGMTGQGDLVAMRPGMFAIFAPNDAHAPGLLFEAVQPVRKAVVKVAV